MTRVPEHSFALPMLGLTGLTIHDLYESELDAIRKDPTRLHDLRLDAHEELLRREAARRWNPDLCDCIPDAAGSGPTLCDYCMDTPRHGFDTSEPSGSLPTSSVSSVVPSEGGPNG